MNQNIVCSIDQFAANGESGTFRLHGGVLQLHGKMTGAGAVAATATLYATNTPGDAASFVAVGALVLAGNALVLGTKTLSTALAYAKVVVTGLAGGTLMASVGASPGAAMDVVAVASGPGSSVQVVIANGQSLSPTIDLGNARLGRIGLPGNIDGAAKLSFQTSHDGATWRNLFDAFGSEYTVAVAVDRSVVPDLTMFAAARYLKIRLDTSAAPKLATANRTIDISTLA